MPDVEGQAAVAALDKVLADKPHKVGHDFSEATRRLTAWRRLLIARWRHTHSETDRCKLEQVNAAISVVVGGQFPLGSIPWPHIEQARQDMAALAQDDGERAVPVPHDNE